MSLAIYHDAWDLDLAICPCDQHFLDWIAARELRGARIFHFGTGNHHLVGRRSAEDGRGNLVLGITASPREHESYVNLVIDRPELGRTYKVLFGDIYQLEPRLLPEFDVVTLFHLGEFRSEKNAAYGAMTDGELAELLLEKLVPGGWLLFYTGSFAYDVAAAIADRLEARGRLHPAGTFATLRLCRKPV
ncbi:MAG: hypothetical protein KatS3mg117_2815 [Geminicoccaceae bacterium]|jgi:hypothetical protein|nr:MAG: hypothetical protein KatS3mg117_2815 [Geminicoccaceae bacterium]